MAYLIPKGTAEYEQEIKRSRFIARSRHIDSADAARQWFTEVSDEFADARHVCWAYIAGAPGCAQQGMSDAGEPAGTAGKPIMNVLQHSGAGEIALVVVRYFGGIKLGAGGLVRAYSSSAAQVMKLTRLQAKVDYQKIAFRVPFADEHVLRRLLEQAGGLVESTEYQEQIKIVCSLPAAEIDAFLSNLPHTIVAIKNENKLSS